MAIVFVGIDLAKKVFALHGVDESGRAAFVRPTVRREQLLEVVTKLPARTIGMEACSGAHYRARRFHQFGRRAGEALEAQRAATAARDELEELRHLDERVAEYDAHVRQTAQADERSPRLMKLSGAGATTASALLASVGAVALKPERESVVSAHSHQPDKQPLAA